MNFAHCVILLCLAFEASADPIKTIFQWKNLEFDYNLREYDLRTGFYNKSVVLPMLDVDAYESNLGFKVFVTMPRYLTGTPATVGIVTSTIINGDPGITPYPDESWHRNPEFCLKDRIVSVYRIKMDECNRLWVLDTGRYGAKQSCRPQILAFNPENNQLLHRFEVPLDLLHSNSKLVTLIVDNRDEACRNTFIYIADVTTFGLLVYNVEAKRAWRIMDKTFFPYPTYGTYTIEGESFDLMDGILGMDLEPYVAGHDRKLFYQAMASGTLNWVYTSNLRNESLFAQDPGARPDIFNTYKSLRNTQSCAMAIDKNRFAYFGLMNDTTLNRWNIRSPEYGIYIDRLIKDREKLQFISGIKVINSKITSRQHLWLVTCRFQKIITDTFNPNEINFRIQVANIDDFDRNNYIGNILY